MTPVAITAGVWLIRSCVNEYSEKTAKMFYINKGRVNISIVGGYIAILSGVAFAALGPLVLWAITIAILFIVGVVAILFMIFLTIVFLRIMTKFLKKLRKYVTLVLKATFGDLKKSAIILFTSER